MVEPKGKVNKNINSLQILLTIMCW